MSGWITRRTCSSKAAQRPANRETGAAPTRLKQRHYYGASRWAAASENTWSSAGSLHTQGRIAAHHRRFSCTVGWAISIFLLHFAWARSCWNLWASHPRTQLKCLNVGCFPCSASQKKDRRRFITSAFSKHTSSVPGFRVVLGYPPARSSLNSHRAKVLTASCWCLILVTGQTWAMTNDWRRSDPVWVCCTVLCVRCVLYIL